MLVIIINSISHLIAQQGGLKKERHKRTYLWVPLDSLSCFSLSLTRTSAELSLKRLLLLLLNLSLVGAILIVLLCFGADIQALVVLLHGKESLSLSQVGSDELGVSLDGLVTVLDCLRERHQLDQGGRAVAVAAVVIRRTLGHLRVGLDRAGPVSFLELLVA